MKMRIKKNQKNNKSYHHKNLPAKKIQKCQMKMKKKNKMKKKKNLKN